MACRRRLLADFAKVESCIGPNFGETLKREAIDDSYNLSRVTEVALLSQNYRSFRGSTNRVSTPARCRSSNRIGWHDAV
jgi:hypothetical protein